MQGTWVVPELQHTVHGGDCGAHGGACVSSLSVRQRVLELCEWRGLLGRETVGVMQWCGHRGGFSVNAGDRVVWAEERGQMRA